MIYFCLGLLVLGVLYWLTSINDDEDPDSRVKWPNAFDHLENWHSVRTQNRRKYFRDKDPGVFLLYFVTNPRLDASKIGVGSAGRVFEFLDSHVEPNVESPNFGWKVLRVAEFDSFQGDYEDSKLSAYEAERRAHFYWRKTLGLKPFLRKSGLGYSRYFLDGDIKWGETKGWSETVQASKICEQSTWNFVLKSYPDEVQDVTSQFNSRARKLKVRYFDHLKFDTPPGYSDSQNRVTATLSPESFPADSQAISETIPQALTRSQKKVSGTLQFDSNLHMDLLSVMLSDTGSVRRKAIAYSGIRHKYRVKIVGCSFYQDNLKRFDDEVVFGYLRAEPENEFDKNAVGLYLVDKDFVAYPVGHLRRETAKKVSRDLLRLESVNHQIVPVRVLITGGTKEKPTLGVVAYIKSKAVLFSEDD